MLVRKPSFKDLSRSPGSLQQYTKITYEVIEVNIKLIFLVVVMVFLLLMLAINTGVLILNKSKLTSFANTLLGALIGIVGIELVRLIFMEGA